MICVLAPIILKNMDKILNKFSTAPNIKIFIEIIII